MEKFKVLFIDHHLLDNFREDLPKDYCWVLVELNDSGHVERIVGTDFGEPEDKTLTRDFSWVADELNNLSSENEELKEIASYLAGKAIIWCNQYGCNKIAEFYAINSLDSFPEPFCKDHHDLIIKKPHVLFLGSWSSRGPVEQNKNALKVFLSGKNK